MTDEQRWSAIFARQVRQLREKRGWSQAELGKQLGKHGHKLGQARIAAIEATGSVTIDQVQAFAGAFGVPVEVLVSAAPPDLKVVQIQRLLQIAGAVDGLRDEVNRLIDQIGTDLPGRLGPPGMTTIVTADRIETFPPLPESE